MNKFKNLNKQEEINNNLTAFKAFEMLEENLRDLEHKISINEGKSDLIKFDLPSMQDFLNSETIFNSDINDEFSDRDAWESFEDLETHYRNLFYFNRKFFHANDIETFSDDLERFIYKVEIYTEEEREDSAKFLKEMESENKFLEKYQGQYIPTR